MREGGSVVRARRSTTTRSSSPSDPGRANVYVTVSAARSPQEEADDTFANPEPTRPATRSTTARPTRSGCAPARHRSAAFRRRLRRGADFRRYKWVNGVLVDENNRALVLTFDRRRLGDTWDDATQWVYVYAVGDSIEPRSEGDRVVVIQHSTISDNRTSTRVAVRNVEVSVRDNDTPGVYVTGRRPARSTRTSARW